MARMAVPSSRAACMRRRERRHAFLEVAVDVLDHDDGIVDHEPDREDQREQRQKIDGESERQHDAERADERQRNGDHRDQHRARRSQKSEDHQHDDDERVDERHGDLVDRCIHEVRRVVHDVALEAAGQLRADVGIHVAHALDDAQSRFARGATWMPMMTAVVPLHATLVS